MGRRTMSADGSAASNVEKTSSRRLPLTARVTLFVFCICAALIVLEGWRIWNAHEQALQGTAVDAANLARAIGQHAQDTVKTADTALVGMVERLENEGTGPEQMARMNRLLALRVAEMPALKGLFVYDETGAWIASSLPAIPSNANNADREYMIYHRNHTDRGPHLGLPVVSRSSGVWVIPVSRRFDHPDGSYAGVVLATLDTAYFQNFYDTFDIGQHGAILLALRDGTLLVRRPLATRSIGQKLTGSSLFQDYLAKSSSGVAAIVSSTDGVTRLNGYRVLDSYPLVVAAALSRDEVLEPWRADAREHLIGVGIVVGILGFLGYRLTRQIGRIADAERAAAAAADRAEAAGAHYRLLADHSTDLIVRIGDGWIPHYVSPASRTLLGFAPEELVGTRAADLIHLDDRPRVADHIRRVIAGAAEPISSFRIRRKNGREIWVEAAYWRVDQGQPGQPPEFVAALRDISGRKEAEARLLDAIEAVNDGFILWGSDHRFVMCNSCFRQLFGFSAALFTPGVAMARFQAEWARLAPGDDRSEPAGDLFAAGGDRPGLAEWHLGDGRWVLGSNRHTSLGGLVGIFTDITERKQRELELAEIRDRLESQAADLAVLADDLSVARDEAERANRLKSEFLAMMSHEIRTPMNGIIGMNGLLLGTPLAPNQRKFAEAVRLSADSLLTILNDILDVSKLEAGKFDLEAVPFDLEEVVEDVIELLSPRAHDKGLEIAPYVAPAALRPLIGDPTRLRQILLNLLSNAVKFTDRGAVGIEVAGVAAGNRLQLRIAVEDTGIGVKDEDKQRLFRKFEQADGSITRRFGGTGLGLNISKQLVELMGGGIGITDRPGGGTIFTIELALPVAEAELPPLAIDVLAGRQALVVAGSDIVRSALQRVLADGGFAVTAVADEAAGLDAAAALHAIDVVLFDQAAGDLPSAAFAAELARRQGEAAPRLALLTSAGLPGEAALGRFDVVLMKPVRRRSLMQCLAHLFGAAVEPDALPDDRLDAVAATGRGGHLLLAEDHAINREVAATILEGFGYTIEFAEDGIEAVAAARRNRYDLILMDVQMPNLDGLEATRQIRALGGAAGAVPIIAMTASAMEGDRRQCLEAGMDDYVSKPIDAPSMLATVARWIDAAAAAAATTEKPETVAPDGPIRDPARLDGLQRMLSPDRFIGLLEAFLDSTGQRFDRVAGLAAAADLDGLRHEAHDMISICGNLGETRMQKLAECLQVACIEGDVVAAKRLIPDLQAATLDAAAFIRTRVPVPAPGQSARR
jgi:two-component system, sensor histidine kinase and response regulator